MPDRGSLEVAQQVQGPHEVGVHVVIKLLVAGPDRDPGGEVEDAINAVERPVHVLTTTHVAVDEPSPRIDRRLAAGREIVEYGHLETRVEQGPVSRAPIKPAPPVTRA